MDAAGGRAGSGAECDREPLRQPSPESIALRIRSFVGEAVELLGQVSLRSERWARSQSRNVAGDFDPVFGVMAHHADARANDQVSGVGDFPCAGIERELDLFEQAQCMAFLRL